MKFHSFSIDPAKDDYIFPTDKPITVFRGEDAELHLFLLSILSGNVTHIDIIEKSDSSLFILHADVEMADEDYRVCYVFSKTEPHRIGVNFSDDGLRCSPEATAEYREKVIRRWTDNNNVFMYKRAPTKLPESKQVQKSFIVFFAESSYAAKNGDDRPIFIYDLFGRIDEAVDPREWLDGLASLERQVFIAVDANYPIDKLAHPSVQIINTSARAT